jgi:phosphoribosylanthranilate isomerase
MVKIKICGITNLEDGLASIAAGADAVGFNFYRRSPRYISPREARSVIDQLPNDVLTVGVLVNEGPPELVKQIADESAVSALQLHGDESPEYCSVLKDRYVIKVFGVGNDFRPAEVMAYRTQAIMLDALDRTARGGTGRVIDWEIARRTRELFPTLFLSGGLSEQNVAEAIQIVKPHGVDACSALEVSPGRKNHKRIQAFISAVREAETEL